VPTSHPTRAPQSLSGPVASAPASESPTDERPTALAIGRLVVIARDGSEGPSHPIGAKVTVGRNHGEVQFPGDQSISPEHVRLSNRDGRVFLTDLGSLNGVYLRLGTAANRSSSIELSDQSLFLLGQQVLRFELLDSSLTYSPLVEDDTVHFGTPTTARYARLRVRSPEGTSLDCFYLKKREIVIGRETGDIVFTDDPFLSRRHAKLVIEGEGSGPRTVQLIDLGSSNGTFYRLRDTEIELYSGDQFRIGQQLLRIDLTNGAPRLDG
jgi:pSer/pThr/pTyr-binding forkhead associated (FHA) protein